MRRNLKIIVARMLLWLAEIDLEWALIEGSVDLIAHKKASYNKAMTELAILDT